MVGLAKNLPKSWLGSQQVCLGGAIRYNHCFICDLISAVRWYEKIWKIIQKDVKWSDYKRERLFLIAKDKTYEKHLKSIDMEG